MNYPLLKILILFVITMTMAMSAEKIYKDVPNISQLKDLNSNRFCGPVAVTNTLLWLRDTKGLKILKGVTNNDKVISFVNTLGSNRYMKTGAQNGTTMVSLFSGLQTYMNDCGYKIGFKELRNNSVKRDRFEMYSFEWIRKMIDEDKCLIMTVKWYDKNKEPGNLVHVDGHYMTCIGYSETDDKKELIFNDPLNENPAQRYTVTMVDKGIKVEGQAIDPQKPGAPIILGGYKPAVGDIGILHYILAYSVQ